MIQDQVGFATAILLKQIEAKPEVRGLLLTGSAARGQAAPSSDVDFHVIHTENVRYRSTWVEGGVEIETFYNPPWKVRQYFAHDVADGTGITLHMFTFGKILLDRDGSLAALVDEATQLWQAGPAPRSQDALNLLGYSLSNMLKDIEDVAYDPDTVRLLGGHLLYELLDNYFVLTQHWIPKGKRRLGELARLAPDYHALILHYLQDPSSTQGIAALRALLDYLGQNLNLPVFQSYLSSIEQLQAPKVQK